MDRIILITLGLSVVVILFLAAFFMYLKWVKKTQEYMS